MPFNRSNNASSAPRRSKYEGVQYPEARDPLPLPGVYRFEVLGCTKGRNPQKKNRTSIKSSLKIVACEDNVMRPNSVVVMLNFLEVDKSMGRLLDFVVHAAGYGPTLDQVINDSATAQQARLSSRKDFEQWESETYFPLALFEGYVDNDPTLPSLHGRLVDCVVTLGNQIEGSDDHWREYEWAAVGDEEQEAYAASKGAQ